MPIDVSWELKCSLTRKNAWKDDRICTNLMQHASVPVIVFIVQLDELPLYADRCSYFVENSMQCHSWYLYFSGCLADRFSLAHVDHIGDLFDCLVGHTLMCTSRLWTPSHQSHSCFSCLVHHLHEPARLVCWHCNRGHKHFVQQNRPYIVVRWRFVFSDWNCSILKSCSFSSWCCKFYCFSYSLSHSDGLQ